MAKVAKTRTRRQRQPSPHAEALRVWRERELLELLGCGRTTLWRWVRDGLFPRPIRLGVVAKGWTERTVRGWLDSRKAA